MLEHISKYESQIDLILDFLSALNDRTRQKIIMIFLNQKEYCANDIANQFSLSRPTISHHLNLMKRSKILIARREGKEVLYSFNKDYVISNLEQLISFLKGCC